jgi:hypothetical protein
MLVIWVGSFVFLAHFIPPPNPTSSARTIQRMFEQHTFRIRLGLVLTMFGSALLVPFSAAISSQMRRIEGPNQVLAGTQIVQGGLLSLEFIVPIMVWLTAAFRPAAISASTVRMLDDMGWIMFVAVISSVCCQVAAIAFVIFLDKRTQPIFPRWAGYLNAWIAVLLAPAGIIVFFKHGPFAWNGLFSFWTPLTVYSIWVVAMTVLLRRAVTEQTEVEAWVPMTVAAIQPVPLRGEGVLPDHSSTPIGAPS